MKKRSKRWLSLGLIVVAATVLAAGPIAMSVQVKSTQVREEPSFLGKVVTDLGGASSVPLILMGDRLGLYQAMASGGPGDVTGAGRQHRLARALRARVAAQSDGERLGPGLPQFPLLRL